MAGEEGNWSADFGALDPATWTPENTLLVGEEWSGQGRLFEVENPMADVANGDNVIVTELNSVPNVNHEGLRFNHDGSAFYFVDEDRSGSIYKFVPAVQGDHSKGQTFVLSVDAYTGSPQAKAPKYSATIDTNSDRSGMATWVAMTDQNGIALTSVDPFNNVALSDQRRAGRAAADELDGTPFRRSEDVEVGYLKNGHEAFYFTATEELAIYSVEELGDNEAMVRLFADESTAKNLGHTATTGHINSPDNLAQDALGNIYMVEDKPNGDDVGGDVWFVRDTNNDGVAESVDHFMSLQVKGAENTGMIFNPANPTEFIINVQHPESTGLYGGMGDATWLLDIKDIVAPVGL
jgi:secreted PhoX family phosphatase